jgi:hypothetical protein
MNQLKIPLGFIKLTKLSPPFVYHRSIGTRNSTTTWVLPYLHESNFVSPIYVSYLVLCFSDLVGLATSGLLRAHTNHNGMKLHIEMKHGRLCTQRVGGIGLHLIPKGPDQYKMEGQLIEIQLEHDGSEQAVAHMLKTRSRETHWTIEYKPVPMTLPQS